MKKLLLTTALLTAITTASAADLTSCAATYTVASAAFAQVGENRNADGAAYYAVEARRAALRVNWGGNTQPANSMYKQALWVQESRFKSNGWPALSTDLKECGAVLKRNNIQ
jgi:hypothetical protein